MMSELYTTLQNDLKSAMLAKDELKRDTVRMLIAACKNEAIEIEGELTDDDVINVLLRERKTRQDSIEQYKLGGREDLAAQEEKEIEVITQYLPHQMSEEEIAEAVSQAIAESGANEIRDMGKVMGILGATLKGKANMKMVSQKVKESLSSK